MRWQSSAYSGVSLWALLSLRRKTLREHFNRETIGAKDYRHSFTIAAPTMGFGERRRGRKARPLHRLKRGCQDGSGRARCRNFRANKGEVAAMQTAKSHVHVTQLQRWGRKDVLTWWLQACVAVDLAVAVQRAVSE